MLSAPVLGIRPRFDQVTQFQPDGGTANGRLVDTGALADRLMGWNVCLGDHRDTAPFGCAKSKERPVNGAIASLTRLGPIDRR